MNVIKYLEHLFFAPWIKLPLLIRASGGQKNWREKNKKMSRGLSTFSQTSHTCIRVQYCKPSCYLAWGYNKIKMKEEVRVFIHITPIVFNTLVSVLSCFSKVWATVLFPFVIVPCDSLKETKYTHCYSYYSSALSQTRRPNTRMPIQPCQW